MQISVILAHPDPGSFNHAIAQTAVAVIKANGHRVFFHDLYQEKFDPLLNSEEIAKDAALSSTIKKHCEEIALADGIVIVHPNWWGQPPAILKGWVDRVIRPGVAYEFLEGDAGAGIPQGLLKAGVVLVFNTSNTKARREKNVFGDPLETIWKNCIFGLCGVSNFHRRLFNVVVTSTKEQRKIWLNEVKKDIDIFFPKLSNMNTKEISKRLQKVGDKGNALFLQRFFKTGAGQYGEGDVFLGIRVPVLRKLAQEYKALQPVEVLPLLQSSYHEERLFALIMLVNAFAKGDEALRRKIYDLYLADTQHINNWDLVDISAPHIVGAFLMDKNRKPLYQLAKSKSLWERRIAILATLYFIRQNQFTDTMQIVELLLRDNEDLIHKAAGWMLREVGKRDLQCAELFLQKHCKKMPRTMLRYAIERFTLSKRRVYLEG